MVQMGPKADQLLFIHGSQFMGCESDRLAGAFVNLKRFIIAGFTQLQNSNLFFEQIYNGTSGSHSIRNHGNWAINLTHLAISAPVTIVARCLP